ncbi:tyrosine-type recombinase/integrase [Catellatospora paridis]|uniref:tyrosine-type recombinase/integrase n=1 Tax=Catellatospora paridis TaxID=1617086 RepID=UPI001E542DFE|nr:tyrosine-type recombinase/integrase [Catellatospora paridis]
MEVARRRYRDPREARVTFDEWVKVWAAEHRVAETTWDSYLGHLRRHIQPELGTTELGDINRRRIKSFVAHLHEKLAPTSVEDVMKVLSLILNEAVAEGRLGRNPCKDVKWHAARTERPHASATQVLLLAGELPYWANQVLVITAAYTGMRWGELAGLHRDNVNLREGWIFVADEDGALKEINGHLSKGKPKTRASRGRYIVLPKFLIDLLALVMSAHEHEHVFVGSRGALQRRSTFGRTWRAGVARATAPAGHRTIRKIRVHDMRHTHKTWMIEDNIPEVAQCARLGHRLEGVRGIYSHVTPAMEQAIIDGLQRRWESNDGPAFALAIHAAAERQPRCPRRAA